MFDIYSLIVIKFKMQEVYYVKTLLKYLKPFYARMGTGFGIKTLGTVFELFIPYILSYILANVMNFSIEETIWWGSLMIICAFFSCAFNIIANRMDITITNLQVNSGNFKAVVLLDDEIVHEFRVNEMMETFTLEKPNGYVSIRIAGESADFYLTFDVI